MEVKRTDAVNMLIEMFNNAVEQSVNAKSEEEAEHARNISLGIAHFMALIANGR